MNRASYAALSDGMDSLGRGLRTRREDINEARRERRRQELEARALRQHEEDRATAKDIRERELGWREEDRKLRAEETAYRRERDKAGDIRLATADEERAAASRADSITEQHRMELENAKLEEARRDKAAKGRDEWLKSFLDVMQKGAEGGHVPQKALQDIYTGLTPEQKQALETDARFAVIKSWKPKEEAAKGGDFIEFEEETKNPETGQTSRTKKRMTLKEYEARQAKAEADYQVSAAGRVLEMADARPSARAAAERVLGFQGPSGAPPVTLNAPVAKYSPDGNGQYRLAGKQGPDGKLVLDGGKASATSPSAPPMPDHVKSRTMDNPIVNEVMDFAASAKSMTKEDVVRIGRALPGEKRNLFADELRRAMARRIGLGQKQIGESTLYRSPEAQLAGMGAEEDALWTHLTGEEIAVLAKSALAATAAAPFVNNPGWNDKSAGTRQNPFGQTYLPAFKPSAPSR